MYHLSKPLFLFLIIGILTFASPAFAEPISLEACIQKAIANNKKLDAEKIGVAVAENERKSVRGHFLPVLRVEAHAMMWNDDNIYSFDMSPLAQMMGPGAAANLPPMDMTIREDMTLDTSVMAIQPLTGLYSVWFAHRAKKYMVESARFSVANVRREIERDVTKAFFSHLAARQMLQSAGAALKQINAFEKMTKDFLQVEMVERNALLKVQVQKAEIQKAIFQAQKGVRLTRSMLNMYMGQPLSNPLDLSYETRSFSKERIALSVTVLQEQSLDLRPDLLSARSQKRAADAGHQATIGQMLPEINLVGHYQNSQQMGDMMPEHQVFAGLMVSWNFWEWGSGYYKVRAAEAKARQAKRMIAFAEDGIRLEVEQRYLDLDEAIRQNEVALARLDFAQENLRIETSRYEVQESTTTDLLQAQTSKLQAQNEVTVAEMNVEVAARNLELSTGKNLVDDKK